MSSLRPNQESYDQLPDMPGRTNLLDLDYKVAALLTYLPIPPVNLIFSVIWLQTEQNSRFLRFHAMQSLVMTVGLFVAGIGIGILSMVLMAIPVIGPAIVGIINLVWGLVGLGFFVLCIVAMMKAYKGIAYKIPLVGDFAASKAEP